MTPLPWRLMIRPDDGVLIIVGADDHTVCEVRVCDDGTHPPKRKTLDAAWIVLCCNNWPGNFDKLELEGE